MKRQQGKLALNRETVRNLSASELVLVNGGTGKYCDVGDVDPIDGSLSTHPLCVSETPGCLGANTNACNTVLTTGL